MKGDPGVPGSIGPPGPRGPQGVKGEKGEQGKSLIAPHLIEAPVGVTVNAGQTAVLKCTVDGHPPPKVTWSKIKSSLPFGRYVIGPNTALIIKNVKPEDAGFYSCSAKNLLGSTNASAPLKVQCEFHDFLSILPLSRVIRDSQPTRCTAPSLLRAHIRRDGVK